MDFDIGKIQIALQKSIQEIQEKHKNVMEEMKHCPHCHEDETKFVPCKLHMDLIKSIGEEMALRNLQTQLKMQLHQEEIQKFIVEQQKKAVEQAAAEKANTN